MYDYISRIDVRSFIVSFCLYILLIGYVVLSYNGVVLYERQKDDNNTQKKIECILSIIENKGVLTEFEIKNLKNCVNL